MTITVYNECGTLIDEYEYETEDANKALRLYLEEEQPILAAGDTIKITF